MDDQTAGYINQINEGIKPGLMIGILISLAIIFSGIMILLKKRSETKKQAEKSEKLKQEMEKMIKNV